MREPGHSSGKLLVAVVMLAASVSFLWFIDSAMSLQYQVLHGCWPGSIIVDGRTVLPDAIVAFEIERRGLRGLDAFFASRLRHRVLFYLLVSCAFVGWSGSFFLRFVKGEEDRRGELPRLPSWGGMLAGFLLSGIAGAIVFLILVSTRLIVDPGGEACISEGYAYLAALGALGSGLFVVVFFDWFRSMAVPIWDRIASRL